MNIKILELKIHSGSGTINFQFNSHITYIYGNIGVGKTTLISLIIYCLGGDLVETPAVKDQFTSAEVHVEIDSKTFVFRREYSSPQIFIRDIKGNVINIHKKEITDFLFQQSGTYSIYYEQKGSNTPNQLTLKNYLWYSYLRQSDIDSNFFYLNKGANEFYQIFSTNVLASLLGKTPFIDTHQKNILRTNRKRLAKYENGIEALEYVLGKEILDSIEQKTISLRNELAQLNTSLVDVTSDATQNESLLRINEIKFKLDFLDPLIPMVLRRNKFYNEYHHLKECVQQFSIEKKTDASFEQNLSELGEIFKKCLLLAGFPSISQSDKVFFQYNNFNPIVKNNYTDIRYDFDSLGSGGKKTLFKICFLVAVHIKAKTLPPKENRLPSFIIIDTPMKNISEREDKALFDNFYTYLMNLFNAELSNTQLIIVDKERNQLLERNHAKIISINKENPLFSGFVDATK